MPTSGDVESTVEEFVELEAELAGSETGASGSYDRGYVADAAKVPAERVPEDYPVGIETTQALRIAVDAGGEEVPVFLEWPGEGEQSDHVGRLLDALDREPDEFASIYGDEIALTERDGWHGIDAEETAALHGGQAVGADASLRRPRRLVLATVIASVLGVTLAGLGGALGAVGALLQTVAMFGMPLAVYKDAGHVDEAIDWDRTTGLWVVGAFVPVVNAVVGSLYLVDRGVQLRGVEGIRPSSSWKYAVAAGVALPLFVVLFAVSTGLGVLAFVGGFVVLPVAIYFDASYVEAATGADTDPALWAIGAFVATFFLLGWLVGIVYLLQRQSTVD